MWLMFRRFKSDLPINGNDLNKKILEAFNSIIDNSAQRISARKEPLVEAIPKYNIDSRKLAMKQQDYVKASPSISGNPVMVKSSPDIFKRSKISPDFLHKNIYLMSKMMTPSGSLLSKSITKLSSKTHRHMSKIVRRARQMGIIPYMYRPKVNLSKSKI